MSYGIVVKNAAGEDIFGGPLYWIRDEPSTTVFARSDYTTYGDVIIPSFATAYQDLANYHNWFRWGDYAMANQSFDHYLCNGFTDLYPLTPTQRQNGNVPNAILQPGELAFFQLDTNGVFSVAQVFNTLPEFPSGSALHVAALNRAAALPCYICSTTPGTPTGTYGMQVFSADGTVEFDSRQKYPRIVDHIYVSKTTIADILENNTVVDLPLSVSVPAPKIACPLWAHGQRNLNLSTGGQIARILMRQLDDMTLRLERIGEAGSGGASFYSRYTHDAYITVAQ